MRTLFAAAPFLCLCLPSPIAAQPPSGNHVDVIVKEALSHWRVPGVAVAILHEDRLVYLKGIGVKELGKSDPMTPETVVPLASCSKTLTATVLAMLVDDGKLDWDDPVRKHLPWFKLADPLADANVTLRDLLTHRTGLAPHNPLWYRSPLTMEERVRRLAFLEPSHSFRSAFQYQAVAFGAAGLAGARAAGTTWHDLMERRLFTPLDMKTASAVYLGAGKADYASPHKRLGERIAVIDRYPLDQPDPAASVHASARDLSRYLRLQLGGGLAQGRRLVSERSLGETHTPQIVIRKDGLVRALNPDSHILTYALGWVAQDYRGRGILIHGGMIAGFRVQLTLVPEARLGIAVLSNLDATWMNFALSNTLIDRYCQLPAKDWNTYCQAVDKQDERDDKQDWQRTLASRRPNTKTSLPLAAYAGTYHDPAYGTCEIRLDKAQLRWKWGNVQSRLEHFHDDMFVAVDEPVDTLMFGFAVHAKEGSVESLRVMDRVFRRRK
ncbi:MAG: serine hydrolase [Gemmataceae bacterium]|nr:serine hydrolase [Gemmataceae bacterium]